MNDAEGRPFKRYCLGKLASHKQHKLQKENDSNKQDELQKKNTRARTR